MQDARRKTAHVLGQRGHAYQLFRIVTGDVGRNGVDQRVDGLHTSATSWLYYSYASVSAFECRRISVMLAR